jgi:GNAT superfamily N-acetyltransferase
MSTYEFLRGNLILSKLQTNDYELVVEKYNLPNNKIFNLMENNQYLFDCYDCKLYLKNTTVFVASLTYYINRGNNLLYLSWQNVESAYQGKGIGTFLVNYTIMEAYNNNVLTIVLENMLDADKTDFYKKFGFIYTDKTDIYGNPKERDQIGMTKFMLTTSKSYAIRSLYESEREMHSQYMNSLLVPKN